MYLLYSAPLLVLFQAVLGRHICLEDFLPGDHAGPKSLHNDKDQSTLSTETPWLSQTFVLGKPVESADNLTNAVNESYLSNLPSEMGVDQTLASVTGVMQNKHTFDSVHDKAQGNAKMVDIQFPLMKTCRPKVSDVRPLMAGLYCTQPAGCQEQHQITLSESFESTFGFKVATTISAEADLKVIKATISTTYEASFEATWSHGKSKTDTYTFNLEDGERCTPSMVRIDLECNVLTEMVYYDTFWEFSTNKMWPEQTVHRTGGPYSKGQWCREAHIQKGILKQEKYWDTVLDEDVGRGKAWNRPSSELNDYKKIKSEPDIRNDQLVIRKGVEGKGGDFSTVFVCNRFQASAKDKTMILPVSGKAGNMLGYVGCVL